MDRTLVWVLLCTLISNSAYALIAPFLPIEYAEKGIKEESVGLIFCIYSVAVIFVSPMVGKHVKTVGSTNFITIGVCFMGICFILFGLVDDMTDTKDIFYYSMVIRLAQGSSSACVQVTCYSIATNDFPEMKDTIVGWLEALTGLGLILGPIIGSLLYSAVGFKHAFFIYGAFLVMLSIVIKINFPKQNITEESEGEYFETTERGED